MQSGLHGQTQLHTHTHTQNNSKYLPMFSPVLMIKYHRKKSMFPSSFHMVSYSVARYPWSRLYSLKVPTIIFSREIKGNTEPLP